MRIRTYLAGYATVAIGNREIHLRVDGLLSTTPEGEAARLVKAAAVKYCEDQIEEALADIAYYSSVIEEAKKP